MAPELFHSNTEVSKWDPWQSALPLFADWSDPRWGFFLLLVLACDVVVAGLAWLLVGLFI
jgi:hypothetical protein